MVQDYIALTFPFLKRRLIKIEFLAASLIAVVGSVVLAAIHPHIGMASIAGSVAVAMGVVLVVVNSALFTLASLASFGIAFRDSGWRGVNSRTSDATYIDYYEHPELLPESWKVARKHLLCVQALAVLILASVQLVFFDALHTATDTSGQPVATAGAMAITLIKSAVLVFTLTCMAYGIVILVTVGRSVYRHFVPKPPSDVAED